MNLLVGCPVSHREWVLPSWYKNVEDAAREAGVEPAYIFVVSQSDYLTLECIESLRVLSSNRSFTVVKTNEPERKDVRVWNPKRYQEMVGFRNLLLAAVRERNPDYFLSLDSDMLLAPDSLKISLAEILDADALGMCAYMSRPFGPVMGGVPRWEMGREMASMGQVVNGRIRNRIHYETMTNTVSVDVIMACKLMKPSAYNIDYESAYDGEDIGWSVACKRQGLKLVWCPKAKAKHVWSPGWLWKEDYRVGF